MLERTYAPQYRLRTAWAVRPLNGCARVEIAKAGRCATNGFMWSRPPLN